MTKSHKVYDLEERTAIFAENIIKLCKKCPKNAITLPIIDQLIRAGTSVGANYCEANGASSRKDFRSKIHICKRESKESKYWLRMLAIACPEITDECKTLLDEAQEFVLIFSKIAFSSS